MAPLMTTVAQPHLLRSVYVPFAPTSPLRAKPGAKPPVPSNGIGEIDRRLIFSPGRQPTHPPAVDPDQPEPGIENPSGDSVPIGPGPLMPGLAILSSPIAPAEETKRNIENKPVKISEGVIEAQLSWRVEPRYPPLAMQTRTQGTVRLHAIISGEGRIVSLEVISGHPLLVQAALDAVRQWRYRPTMLDGEPVEVETTITVVFQLHN
jgi:periplasmic protein TonB